MQSKGGAGVVIASEIWKPIPGWATLYQVSNLGRIKSLKRTTWCKNPKGQLAKRIYLGRILKTDAALRYPGVQLCSKNKQKHYSVHSLVLLTFRGPPSKGMEVCHNNGRSFDNRLSNLRYDTRSANALDKRKHGWVPKRGSDCFNAKFSKKQISEIRTLNGVVSSRKLALQFQVSHSTILAIWNRKRY